MSDIPSICEEKQSKEALENHAELFERGTYVLALDLTRGLNLNVGSLGRIRFAAGHYAYVGSARRGMRARVARHLAREKRKWWHIDWLTTQAGVVPVAVATTERVGLECGIASALSNGADAMVKGFGCSDCECESHLFYFSNDSTLSLAIGALVRYGVRVEWFRQSHTGLPGEPGVLLQNGACRVGYVTSIHPVDKPA